MRCGFSGNVLLVAASTLLAPALGTGLPILAKLGHVHDSVRPLQLAHLKLYLENAIELEADRHGVFNG